VRGHLIRRRCWALLLAVSLLLLVWAGGRRVSAAGLLPGMAAPHSSESRSRHRLGRDRVRFSSCPPAEVASA
jgi:hypothetical protein